MKNEIDKLREILTEAGIPFESYIEPFDLPFNDETSVKVYTEHCGDAARYRCNKVIYGRYEGELNGWKFSGIYQLGSYGAKQGMIEAYGTLGKNKSGFPRTMTADEAFEIIKNDWDKTEGK